jgi:hypothetical protein
VDFANYTGQITGIRIKFTASANNDPVVVFQQLLGNRMSDSDIWSMFERCNGDSIFPYADTGIMGSSPPSSMTGIIWPELYQAFASPAVMTAMLSNDQAAIQKATLSALPIYNVNFTRNTKIAPLNLVNQNVKSIFNNMYGNLQKNGILLQSVILDNTNEFPRKMCANQQAPALSPKIRVQANTTCTGFKIETSLMMIMYLFELHHEELLWHLAEIR